MEIVREIQIIVLVNLTIISQIYGADFTTFMKNSSFSEMRCSSDVLSEKTEIRSELQCAYLCMREATCWSVFYSDTTSQCFGCTAKMTSNSDLVPMTGSFYYHKTGPEYVGCYADKLSPRAMDNRVLESTSMTIDLCLDLCKENGTLYFGLQFGWECWCSNTYDRHGPSTGFNMQCAGNQEPMCGGSYAISVYKVG